MKCSLTVQSTAIRTAMATPLTRSAMSSSSWCRPIGADALDIGGFTILEASMPVLPRHTFDAGTVLAPGEAVVVFGGHSSR